MHQPIVGDPPEYPVAADEVPWVLGTQLTEQSGPVARVSDGHQVLLIEAHDFARRMPYHHHKLTLIFTAMRRFRDQLEAAGYEVTYIRAATFGEGLATFFEANPETTLVTMRSPSYGAPARLQNLVADAGGSLRVVENELFVSTRQAFDEWANSDGGFRHERFYRWMRQEADVLMADGDPVGGEWNYDANNRDVPPTDWDAPPVPAHKSGSTLEDVSSWVADEFETWGSQELETFPWPVTRNGALEQLDQFIAKRLPDFGPYQDAMREADWAMSHALLSGAVNIGLLHPLEVIGAIERAYDERQEVPLSSAEGAIRQVLGWREFMRHIYRHTMPELASANQLNADANLPEIYWTGETDMRCLSATIEDVHQRGYAHHIQRLMVLANFATMWGVEPAELNRWFHATYIDAYHWVTTPNVVEMGQYGHGVFATKPYVSSANYVEKMSDYCEDCAYDPDADTTPNACPFNALYWDFLDRNEEPLRSNHRMGLMYSHVDSKRESGEMDAIRERVDTLREQATDGDL
jgi:deoxyribodipyrimidine photolyase-related protein